MTFLSVIDNANVQVTVAKFDTRLTDGFINPFKAVVDIQVSSFWSYLKVCPDLKIIIKSLYLSKPGKETLLK